MHGCSSNAACVRMGPKSTVEDSCFPFSPNTLPLGALEAIALNTAIVLSALTRSLKTLQNLKSFAPVRPASSRVLSSRVARGRQLPRNPSIQRSRPAEAPRNRWAPELSRREFTRPDVHEIQWTPEGHVKIRADTPFQRAERCQQDSHRFLAKASARTWSPVPARRKTGIRIL